MHIYIYIYIYIYILLLILKTLITICLLSLKIENEFYYVKNNKYNPAMEEGDNPRHDLNFKNHLHKRQRVNKTSTYWYRKTSSFGGSVTIFTEEEVVNSTSSQRLRVFAVV